MKANASSIILRVVQWVLFVVGILSLLVGVVIVHLVSQQEERTRARDTLAKTGTIDPVDAVVTQKRIRESSSTSRVGGSSSTSTTTKYEIVLKIDDSQAVSRNINHKVYDTVREGDVYKAYLIDGRYFVPHFDSQTYDYVKWIIFGVTCMPMLCAIVVLIVRMITTFKARSREGIQKPGNERIP